MIKRIEFGSEAVGYVRDQLKLGKTLSKCLLDLALDEGQVVAFLSSTSSPERIRSFRTGGVSNEQTLPTEVSFILEYLSEGISRYAIFEEPNIRVNDRGVMESSKEQFFSHNLEVYSFLSSHDLDPTKIRRTTTSASESWFALGILVTLNEKTLIQDRQSVTAEFLQNLAIRTDYMLVGAYDNEAKLIWIRPNLQK